METELYIVSQEIDSAEMLPAGPCRNCGQMVMNSFCGNCGQEHSTSLVPLKEFFKDILGEFISVDSKVVRSISPLVTRPGFLTNEYIAGRRVSYLLPSRLYILISIAFFFLVTNFDPLRMQDFFSQQDLASAAGIKGMSAGGYLAALNDKANAVFPTVLLVGIIPAFALLMKFLYLGSKLLYVQHLIFAFHFFSLILIAFIPALLLGSNEIVTYVLFGSTLIYLLLALRAVYRQSWLKTTVKSAVAWFGMTMLIALSAYIAGLIGAMRI
jgi:hypothetical protein